MRDFLKAAGLFGGLAAAGWPAKGHGQGLNTFQGARSVDADLIHSARFLGAGDGQVTRTVIVPPTTGPARLAYGSLVNSPG
jgi:hypothetical protein